MSNTDTDSCPDDNREERDEGGTPDTPDSQESVSQDTSVPAEVAYPKVTDPIFSKMLQVSERAVEINMIYHQGDNDLHPVIKESRRRALGTYEKSLGITHDDKIPFRVNHPRKKGRDCRNFVHTGSVPISFLATIPDESWEEGWDEMAWEMAIAGEFRLQPLEVVYSNENDEDVRSVVRGMVEHWFANLLGFDTTEADDLEAINKMMKENHRHTLRSGDPITRVVGSNPWKGLITSMKISVGYYTHQSVGKASECIYIAKLGTSRPKLRRVLVQLIFDFARLLGFDSVIMSREYLTEDERVELGFENRYDRCDYLWVEKPVPEAFRWANIAADVNMPEVRSPGHR